MQSPDLSVVADQPSVSRNRLVLVVYTAAIFVSALLLFSVQPLFTKMVLPRLGGSPAVWSVAMVFFQSLLLGGYAYAHYLMQIRNRVIPATAAMFGEVGLAGEIRGVTQATLRVREAAQMGFRRCIMPAANIDPGARPAPIGRNMRAPW